jgi:hypothetical protein
MGESLVDRYVDAVVAALLLLLFAPLLAWYWIRAGLRPRTAAFRRGQSVRLATLNNQIAGEFNFEHAIEAYEELIDATLAESRP